MSVAPESVAASLMADPGPAEPSRAHVAGWVRDYAQDLRRFLAKRRFIESDINDVCQEVYLRLLRFERPQVVKNPAAYLFRVAANVAHDFKLRQTRWVSLAPQELEEMQGDLRPEDVADAAAVHRALYQALARLPPVPRAALVLQAREDLSLEEIAQRLGTTRRAVRRAITRGHELLREALHRDI